MNFRLIGTSHIAAQSVQEITAAITTERPDIIAVELDVQRAAALLQDEKRKVSLADIRSIGVKGFIFAKIGQYVQQKLGKIVGVAPGSEMKTALELARKEKIDVAFIDQPIQITLQQFSKSLTWKEKGRFVSDIAQGLFFPKRQIKKLGLLDFDLRKVPPEELITKMMKTLRKRYPTVYKVLVEDRNKYMVKKLVALMRQYPEKKILAIVGAGHKEGMEKLLLKVDVVGN